jgi:hypothetical protein
MTGKVSYGQIELKLIIWCQMEGSGLGKGRREEGIFA